MQEIQLRAEGAVETNRYVKVQKLVRKEVGEDLHWTVRIEDSDWERGFFSLPLVSINRIC